jgi:hypothetical protein
MKAIQIIVSFCVLFVCKCVLYYCHRVTTQLQLANISYQISGCNIVTKIALKIRAWRIEAKTFRTFNRVYSTFSGIPLEERFSHTCSDRHLSQPSCLYMVIWLFLGWNRPERDADHPLTSSVGLWWSCTSVTLLCLCGHFMVWTLHFIGWTLHFS